jgi:hypothetical protein
MSAKIDIVSAMSLLTGSFEPTILRQHIQIKEMNPHRYQLGNSVCDINWNNDIVSIFATESDLEWVFHVQGWPRKGPQLSRYRRFINAIVETAKGLDSATYTDISIFVEARTAIWCDQMQRSGTPPHCRLGGFPFSRFIWLAAFDPKHTDEMYSIINGCQKAIRLADDGEYPLHHRWKIRRDCFVLSNRNAQCGRPELAYVGVLGVKPHTEINSVVQSIVRNSKECCCVINSMFVNQP